MRDVAIIGAGMIPFGRRDEDTLMEMLAYASLKALDDAGLGDKCVDAVYGSNTNQRLPVRWWIVSA
jgi:acetyl-CoA acetyltransferase